MFDEILTSIITLATTGTNLYSSIIVGSLPPDNGIACYLGPGAPISEDMRRGSVHELNVVFNAKNTDQQICISSLSAILRKLTLLVGFPHGDGWVIANISTGMTPEYTGQYENNQWLYTATFKVLVYLKGV